MSRERKRAEGALKRPWTAAATAACLITAGLLAATPAGAAPPAPSAANGTAIPPALAWQLSPPTGPYTATPAQQAQLQADGRQLAVADCHATVHQVPADTVAPQPTNGPTGPTSGSPSPGPFATLSQPPATVNAELLSLVANVRSGCGGKPSPLYTDTATAAATVARAARHATAHKAGLIACYLGADLYEYSFEPDDMYFYDDVSCTGDVGLIQTQVCPGELSGG